MPSKIEQRHRPIPLWLKISYTLMVCIIVPIYWRDHGPSNFLWFSDIALISLVAALWLEDALIPSMMALGALPFEIMWIIDFTLGGQLTGIAAYMFEAEKYPLYLRALSLFHLVLPPVIIYMLVKKGYDHRALAAQTILAAIVLPICYAFTSPSENINWVFGPGYVQDLMPPVFYLIMLMVTFPLCIYFPLHLFFKKILADARSSQS